MTSEQCEDLVYDMNELLIEMDAIGDEIAYRKQELVNLAELFGELHDLLENNNG